MKWPVLLALVLAGCAADQLPPRKPLSEMAPPERCARLLELSGSSYMNPGERAAAYELARNSGCMGSPQPQTVIVR